jgi:spore coat polysaccharide biosynthesis protein SpsF (cytidylyltransferase family)
LGKIGEEMKVLAIIQARVGSTRLPSKVLMKLQNKTVLEHVVNRVKRSKYIDEVIVATTINKEDLEIVKICANQNIRVFCGSQNDVLDRFYQIAKILKPVNIVRITADCPLMDANVIDKIIKEHLKTKSDYTSNTLRETYPDGEDVEVFKFDSLEKAWNKAKLNSEREHVTPYIKKFFKTLDVCYKQNLHAKRWTLDKKEDFEFIKIIYNNLYKKNKFFGIEDVLKFLEKNPEIEKINQHITRNEGYKKSILED